MMRDKKSAPVAGTTKGASKKLLYEQFITYLLVIATIISGWHIDDIWSGVVTMLCGTAAIGLFYGMIGGRNDRI